MATTETERLHLLVAALEKDKLELDNVRTRALAGCSRDQPGRQGHRRPGSELAALPRGAGPAQSITTGYHRLQTLRNRERELNDLARQSRDLDGEIHRLERAIDQERGLLLNQIGFAERTISESRRVLETRPELERQLAEVRAELARFETLDKEWVATQIERDGCSSDWPGCKGRTTS